MPLRFGGLTTSLYAVSVVFCLLIRFVSSIPIDNGVVGTPEVECGPTTISAIFNTSAPFEGNVYVKGLYAQPGCRAPGNGRQHIASITLPFDSCNIQRVRSLNPNGVTVSVTVIISFHPHFETKVDRAYQFQCFYTQGAQTVSTFLEGVSPLVTSGIQTQIVPMPTCRYEILDGPKGKPIKFAMVGQPVFHKWTCSSESAANTFCMRVYSCYVDDGKGDRVELLDEKGCSLDKHLLSNLEYAGDLAAGKEAHVFKFADRVALYFQCQVDILMKDHENKYVAPNCPRPQCPETNSKPPVFQYVSASSPANQYWATTSAPAPAYQSNPAPSAPYSEPAVLQTNYPGPVQKPQYPPTHEPAPQFGPTPGSQYAGLITRPPAPIQRPSYIGTTPPPPYPPLASIAQNPFSPNRPPNTSPQPQYGSTNPDTWPPPYWTSLPPGAPSTVPPGAQYGSTSEPKPYPGPPLTLQYSGTSPPPPYPGPTPSPPQYLGTNPPAPYLGPSSLQPQYSGTTLPNPYPGPPQVAEYSGTTQLNPYAGPPPAPQYSGNTQPPGYSNPPQSPQYSGPSQGPPYAGDISASAPPYGSTGAPAQGTTSTWILPPHPNPRSVSPNPRGARGKRQGQQQTEHASSIEQNVSKLDNVGVVDVTYELTALDPSSRSSHSLAAETAETHQEEDPLPGIEPPRGKLRQNWGIPENAVCLHPIGFGLSVGLPALIILVTMSMITCRFWRKSRTEPEPLYYQKHFGASLF